MTLAHQGGWDEILFVLIPLVLLAVLLLITRRRVDQQVDAADGESNPPDSARE